MEEPVRKAKWPLMVATAKSRTNLQYPSETALSHILRSTISLLESMLPYHKTYVDKGL